MAIARHDAVRMTFNGACQHRIVCRVNLNHLNLQSAGCNLGFLDEQAEQRLFFVWRKADEAAQLRIGKDSPEFSKQGWRGEEDESLFLPGASDSIRDASWPDSHTDELVCVQDRANHRRARDARTASSMVASSCFAGILFVRALICSRILKRSSRSR